MKSLVKATGAENYNVLQNNGRLAHQQVDHVHFHMVSTSTPLALNSPLMNIVQIPKPNETEGMGITWPMQTIDMDKLKALHADIKSKM